MSKVGQPHHFLASDVQRPEIQWAKCVDRNHAFQVFDADMRPITHADYYEMAELGVTTDTIGPPGFNRKSGTKPTGIYR